MIGLFCWGWDKQNVNNFWKVLRAEPFISRVAIDNDHFLLKENFICKFFQLTAQISNKKHCQNRNAFRNQSLPRIILRYWHKHDGRNHLKKSKFKPESASFIIFHQDIKSGKKKSCLNTSVFWCLLMIMDFLCFSSLQS